MVGLGSRGTILLGLCLLLVTYLFSIMSCLSATLILKQLTKPMLEGRAPRFLVGL